MGLIARELEQRGIPTVCLTSAWSITHRVNPPRAAFVDFPLGHTAGKPHDRAVQQLIVRSALELLVTVREPGTMVALPVEWRADDAWKDRVMRPDPDSGAGSAAARDDRTERRADPQYQDEADRTLAEAAGSCTGCIWPPA